MDIDHGPLGSQQALDTSSQICCRWDWLCKLYIELHRWLGRRRMALDCLRISWLKALMASRALWASTGWKNGVPSWRPFPDCTSTGRSWDWEEVSLVLASWANSPRRSTAFSLVMWGSSSLAIASKRLSISGVSGSIDPPAAKPSGDWGICASGVATSGVQGRRCAGGVLLRLRASGTGSSANPKGWWFEGAGRVSYVFGLCRPFPGSWPLWLVMNCWRSSCCNWLICIICHAMRKACSILVQKDRHRYVAIGNLKPHVMKTKNKQEPSGRQPMQKRCARHQH